MFRNMSLLSLGRDAFTRIARRGGRLTDVGQIYLLPKERRLRFHAEDLAGASWRFIRRSEDTPFMYRRTSFLLDKYISKFAHYKRRIPALNELRNGKAGFILYGDEGVGKSTLLNQCVHFSRCRGILTLCIPRCDSHTRGPHHLEPSILYPGYFDTQAQTEEFLRCTLRSNKFRLRKMRFTPPLELPMDIDNGKQPKTLFDLLLWGSKGIDRTGIALKLFMDALEKNTKTPVVIVLNRYQHFMHETEYVFGKPSLVDEQPAPVHAEKLTIVRHLNRLLAAPARNNVLFIASGSHGPGGRPLVPEDTPFHPIKVEPFTDEELRVFTHHMITSGPYKEHYRQPESLVLPTLDRLCYKLGFTTGNNPLRVQEALIHMPTWQYP